MNSKKGLNKILLYLGSPVVRVFLFIFNGIKDLQCKLQSKHIDIRALLTLCIPSGFEQYSIAISNGPSAAYSHRVHKFRPPESPDDKICNRGVQYFQYNYFLYTRKYVPVHAHPEHSADATKFTGHSRFVGPLHKTCFMSTLLAPIIFRLFLDSWAIYRP